MVGGKFCEKLVYMLVAKYEEEIWS